MSSAGLLLLFSTAVVLFAVAPLVQPGTIVYNHIDWSKTGGGAKRYALGAYAKFRWHDARKYCNNHCMELASIRNTQEQQAVVDLIRRTEGFDKEARYWIGGNQIASPGKWVWSGSLDPVDYTYWKVGQPTRWAKQDCLSLFDDGSGAYGWKDDYCDVLPVRFFICEHNTTYPHDYV